MRSRRRVQPAADAAAERVGGGKLDLGLDREVRPIIGDESIAVYCPPRMAGALQARRW